AIAEQSLKDDLGVGLKGKRFRRAGPGNRIHVRTAVAPGTCRNGALILALDLNRRQYVSLAVFLRDDLVDRDPQMNIRAHGLLRSNAAEHRRAPGMISARFSRRGHG